jgi:molecular chaperone GrpE
MKGSGVDLKKEQTTKPEENVCEQQSDQQELHAETERQDQTKETEVDKEEEFNPETADRDALLEKYGELEGRLGEAEERVLRTAADAENFKKRLQREKEEQTRYSNEAFMRELLPVIDNLERALKHSQAESNQEGLVDGLKMTLKGFIEAMARFGCTQVEAVGKVFDPNFHEAVSQEESENHEANNTVLRELQKGYLLKERLLRPAMVVVSKSSNLEANAASKQTTDGSAKAEKGEVKIKVKKE